MASFTCFGPPKILMEQLDRKRENIFNSYTLVIFPPTFFC